MAALLDRETVWAVACNAFENACGSPDRFEHFVRSDDRLRGLNSWQIALVVKLCLILFQIWMASSTNQPSAIKDPVFPENFDFEFGKAQTHPLDHPEEDD
jgi:hypothetical protein